MSVSEHFGLKVGPHDGPFSSSWVAPGPWAFLVVENVLGAIKSFHDQGKEPLVSKVAKAVGVATIPMGWLLGKHGIRATKVHRGGKQGRCFTFDMGDRIPWYNKGNALYDQGKFDEAILAYDEAIRIDPEYDMAWNSKGAALGIQGKFDEALKCFDEAIRLDPEYAYAWNNKGEVLRDQGKYDEAIQAYDEAIRLDLEYVDAWNNKGNALEALGMNL